MFDLQPPRHISTLRVSPVAAHSDDRLLSEPTAGTHPCLREPLFMPLSGHDARPEKPRGRAGGGGSRCWRNWWLAAIPVNRDKMRKDSPHPVRANQEPYKFRGTEPSGRW